MTTCCKVAHMWIRTWSSSSMHPSSGAALRETAQVLAETFGSSLPQADTFTSNHNSWCLKKVISCILAEDVLDQKEDTQLQREYTFNGLLCLWVNNSAPVISLNSLNHVEPPLLGVQCLTYGKFDEFSQHLTAGCNAKTAEATWLLPLTTLSMFSLLCQEFDASFAVFIKSLVSTWEQQAVLTLLRQGLLYLTTFFIFSLICLGSDICQSRFQSVWTKCHACTCLSKPACTMVEVLWHLGSLRCDSDKGAQASSAWS